MAKRLYRARCISVTDPDQNWDPNTEPTESSHEIDANSVSELREELRNVGYTPPGVIKVWLLKPSQSIVKRYYKDHHDGDLGGIPEGYVIKRIR